MASGMELSNLGFIKDLLRDLVGENLGWSSVLQDLVLTDGEEAFE